MSGNNQDFGSPGGFSGIAGTDGPDASQLESIKASLASEFAQTTGGVDTDTASATPTETTGGSSSPTSSAATTSEPTTFDTSTLFSQPPATPTDGQTITGTAADAASSTTGEAPTVSEQDCDSISCNPGLQAAIAVPVVVAALAILAFLFFCVRRRRRRGRNPEPVSEKPQPPKKKWSRHLRVFSFDAELLMGGFRSSSNSIRSRQTGSVRSGGDHGATPSIHSIDEVAPPYRDAVTAVRRPSPLGVTSVTPEPYPRPDSVATAPPPYVAAGTTSRQSNRPTTPRDPFADASPVSPTEFSPFNDDAHPISRQSSLLHSINDDGNSTIAASDTGSIREAQVGRSLSVMSGGRTVNVRNGGMS
jgi:hypothetical protein